MPMGGRRLERARPSALAGFLALALGALAAGPAGAQTLAEVARAAQGGGGAIFGSAEVRSDSLRGLPQWVRVLNGMRAERGAFEGCAADPARCTTPILKNWRKIITRAGKLSRPEKLKAVNDFFNRWPYKQDKELYGRAEYWATPTEFMARSGDCEDFSIAKYFALRQLGFAKDEMRIVILMDEIRGIGHAVLAVYEGDDILILDSLSNLIVPHDRYRHYRPQYSMNETTRWAHIGGFEKQPKSQYKGLLARRNQ
jgi:predicted transglutaminase-like cysteine proteinase